MAMCEDYPCCGHTDGLPCDWTPDHESIWAHVACEHEAGYCALEDRDDDVDPEDCEHGDATDYLGWVCDGCGEPLVMVTDVSPRAYPSTVAPGLMVEVPVLGWHFEVLA